MVKASANQPNDGHVLVSVQATDEGTPLLEGSPLKRRPPSAGSDAAPVKRTSNMLFAMLAAGSIMSAIGFSSLQEWVFKIPDFKYGGWMTFVTYLTYATCGALESVLTRGSVTRAGRLRDYAIVSLLAMSGAYLTNWALTYLNYTTRIVFKSCRVMPVMAFRTLVVGQRYSVSQYAAGATLVAGITLFSIGDAEGTPNFHWAGIALISLALVCDAMTANLEERWFFRIRTPASHSEVMLYLSCFAAVYSGVVLVASGEVWDAVAHSMIHTSTVPMICAFSVLGYITVCLILTIIKNFGATNAEIVKSLRKVFQIAVSFMLFPKVLTPKYIIGGLLVTFALWWLQHAGRGQEQPRPTAQQQHQQKEAQKEQQKEQHQGSRTSSSSTSTVDDALPQQATSTSHGPESNSYYPRREYVRP